MKLERTSLLAVVVCSAGLITLLLYGVWSSRQHLAEHDELRSLQNLKVRLDQLSVAADGLLLFSAQPDLLQAFHREAQALQDRLAALPDTSGNAAEVARRIAELRQSLAMLERAPQQDAEGQAPPPIPRDAPGSIERLTLLASVSNSGVAIDRSFATLLSQREEAAHAYTRTLIATFILATAFFGLICIAAFAYIHRRIATSISLLADTVEQICSGKTYLRVSAQRDDEVGALGRAINRLLDAQAEALTRIDHQRQQIRQQAEIMLVAGDIAKVGGWSVGLGDEKVIWSDVVKDIHGVPLSYSPTPEGAIGFYAKEDQPRIREAFMACVNRGIPYDLRLQIVDSNGRSHWVRTVGIPVHSDRGQVVGVQGALQDISEQVETEQQLGRVQRLESIGQLTGGIAHDFNNILTVILGNAELLVEELDDDSLGALAGMIRDSAERGARLTHQLLAFARRQTLHPQTVRLDCLLDGIHDMLDRSVGEDVTLIRRTGETLWPCRLDAAQLENAVLNLVINARDAMPRGGTLEITTENHRCEPDTTPPIPDMPCGDYACLSVSDTGEGIARENMERLFEPFFTTKPKGRGTGLGLPMIYGFVKQSSGFISIDSQPGKGTRVTLYFPRSEEEPESASPAVIPEGPLQRARRDYRILLVEDDDLVRRYVEQQLQSLGYLVVSAAAGKEALEILRKRTDIDLLFTDVIMPGGMSGRDLAEAAVLERPGLRVLFTSGYSQGVIAHDYQLDDGIDLLRKPYRREELIQKLASVFGERPA
ncbi:ATP-binding protein [Chromatocurvus halotolerans]|uniref:histidine kinase n=1 Tax=Chromatocurvus halotolerans TaxID=1132028 RepID=A0A4R2KWI4_9GAMM|nr:ATP-binding protein [Chromatocurvus halotolerans]TCO78344.1 PAS domain S-box-containing protein [Chromatocurvus halotolerans]